MTNVVVAPAKPSLTSRIGVIARGGAGTVNTWAHFSQGWALYSHPALVAARAEKLDRNQQLLLAHYGIK